MYCIKCGEDNLEAAKFCRKCGGEMTSQRSDAVAEPRPTDEGEEETRVAARIGGSAETDESEAEIFAISPTLMFVKAGYVLAAIGALLLVAVTSTFFSQFVSVWLSILIGLLLFLIPAFFHFKQKLVRYTLTDSKLEIDAGFISRTTRSVPIRRIQDVTVTSSVVQRLLGFGNLVIDNASEEGGKLVLTNINTPKHYADVLLRQMRRLDS